MTISLIPSTLPAVLSPVLTPFKADSTPDTQKLLKQCKWLSANGVGQAIFGTNSEANSMSATQKMNTLTTLIEGGLNPEHMMPGTGSTSVESTYRMTAHAFFSEVIQRMGNSALQIYIYNIPPVTKINLSLSLLERLIKEYPKTVVGMKDSSGDWEYTESVIKLLAPSGFRVYAGSETFLMRTLRAGGVGCISATANVNPKAIADLATHWRDSNADERQTDLDKVRSVFAHYQMIAGMKTAVAHFSKDPEWLKVRPPLMQLSADQQAKLLSELKAIDFSMPGL